MQLLGSESQSWCPLHQSLLERSLSVPPDSSFCLLAVLHPAGPEQGMLQS